MSWLLSIVLSVFGVQGTCQNQEAGEASEHCPVAPAPSDASESSPKKGYSISNGF